MSEVSSEKRTSVSVRGSTKRCLYLDASVSVAVSPEAAGSKEDVDGN